MIEDPEIRELQAKQRRASLKKVGIVVLIAIGAAAVVIPRESAAVGMLEEKGHTNVEVERDGLFAFGFSSLQGDAKCQGKVTILPGSTSQRQMCLSSGGGVELSETSPDGRETGTVTP